MINYSITTTYTEYLMKVQKIKISETNISWIVLGNDLLPTVTFLVLHVYL